MTAGVRPNPHGPDPDAPTDIGGPATLRIDRLLVYLRFARTRSSARAMIEGRALRRNRKHVHRVSEQVAIGDVLTVVIGKEVHVVELLSLPTRRAPPVEARSHYLKLDPQA